MAVTVVSATQVAKKMRLVFDVPVNHRLVYHQPVNSINAPESQAFADQFSSYAADYENGVKDGWAFWHVKDETRTVQYTMEVVTPFTPASGENPAIEGAYICHVTIDVVNAVARLEADIETDLEGQDLVALQQQVADATAQGWLEARGFTPLA